MPSSLPLGRSSGLPLFVCVVVGDPGLGPDLYEWFCAALDHCFARRLPGVKVLHGIPAVNGTARLAARYARERGLLAWEMMPRTADRPGTLDMLSPAGLDGAVMFRAGSDDPESEEVAARIRGMGLPVRVVDVGALLAAD
jgi:hypothetical protein